MKRRVAVAAGGNDHGAAILDCSCRPVSFDRPQPAAIRDENAGIVAGIVAESAARAVDPHLHGAAVDFKEGRAVLPELVAVLVQVRKPAAGVASHRHRGAGPERAAVHTDARLGPSLRRG